MGKINTENLEEGMVLNADVKSGNQILLPKGVKLSNKHINIFKSWGVNAVEVDGACEQDITNKKLEEVSPKERALMERDLKEKFRYVDLSFTPAQILYNNCLLHKLK